LAGFLIGFGLASSLAAPNQQTQAIIIGIVGAIIGLVLAFPLWSIGAVIYGAAFGLWAGLFLGAVLGVGSNISIVIGVIVAVIFAVLFFIVRRQMVILATAIAGAAAIVQGIGVLLIEGLNVPMNSSVANVTALILWVVLAMIGFVAQMQLFASRELDW
jgi:hypothetical protein